MEEINIVEHRIAAPQPHLNTHIPLTKQQLFRRDHEGSTEIHRRAQKGDVEFFIRLAEYGIKGALPHSWKYVRNSQGETFLHCLAPRKFKGEKLERLIKLFEIITPNLTVKTDNNQTVQQLQSESFKSACERYHILQQASETQKRIQALETDKAVCNSDNKDKEDISDYFKTRYKAADARLTELFEHLATLNTLSLVELLNDPTASKFITASTIRKLCHRQDDKGWTLLHHAAAHCGEAIDRLLQLDIDFGAKSKKGNTALQLACQFRTKQIKKLCKYELLPYIPAEQITLKEMQLKFKNFSLSQQEYRNLWWKFTQYPLNYYELSNKNGEASSWYALIQHKSHRSEPNWKIHLLVLIFNELNQYLNKKVLVVIPHNWGPHRKLAEQLLEIYKNLVRDLLKKNDTADSRTNDSKENSAKTDGMVDFDTDLDIVYQNGILPPFYSDPYLHIMTTFRPIIASLREGVVEQGSAQPVDEFITRVRRILWAVREIYSEDSDIIVSSPTLAAVNTEPNVAVITNLDQCRHKPSKAEFSQAIVCYNARYKLEVDLVKNSHCEFTVELLELSKPANSIEKNKFYNKDQHGRCLFHYLALSGQIELLTNLMGFCQNLKYTNRWVTIPDNCGNTPLDYLTFYNPTNNLDNSQAKDLQIPIIIRQLKAFFIQQLQTNSQFNEQMKRSPLGLALVNKNWNFILAYQFALLQVAPQPIDHPKSIQLTDAFEKKIAQWKEDQKKFKYSYGEDFKPSQKAKYIVRLFQKRKKAQDQEWVKQLLQYTIDQLYGYLHQNFLIETFIPGMERKHGIFVYRFITRTKTSLFHMQPISDRYQESPYYISQALRNHHSRPNNALHAMKIRIQSELIKNVKECYVYTHHHPNTCCYFMTVVRNILANYAYIASKCQLDIGQTVYTLRFESSVTHTPPVQKVNEALVAQEHQRADRNPQSAVAEIERIYQKYFEVVTRDGIMDDDYISNCKLNNLPGLRQLRLQEFKTKRKGEMKLLALRLTDCLLSVNKSTPKKTDRKNAPAQETDSLKQWQTICNSFAQHKDIQILTLDNEPLDKLPPTRRAMLLRAISSITTLRQLNLRSCGLVGDDLIHLQSAIRTVSLSRGRSALRIGNNHLTLEDLFPYAGYLSTLSILDVSHCNLGESALTQITNVADDKITHEINPMFNQFFAILNRAGSVCEIDLSYNQLGILFPADRRNASGEFLNFLCSRHLRILHFAHNDLTGPVEGHDRSLEPLYRRFDGLQYIDIRGNGTDTSRLQNRDCFNARQNVKVICQQEDFRDTSKYGPLARYRKLRKAFPENSHLNLLPNPRLALTNESQITFDEFTQDFEQNKFKALTAYYNALNNTLKPHIDQCLSVANGTSAPYDEKLEKFSKIIHVVEVCLEVGEQIAHLCPEPEVNTELTMVLKVLKGAISVSGHLGTHMYKSKLKEEANMLFEKIQCINMEHSFKHAATLLTYSFREHISKPGSPLFYQLPMSNRIPRDSDDRRVIGKLAQLHAKFLFLSLIKINLNGIETADPSIVGHLLCKNFFNLMTHYTAPDKTSLTSPSNNTSVNENQNKQGTENESPRK